jgi:hypothetical protein
MMANKHIAEVCCFHWDLIVENLSS